MNFFLAYVEKKGIVENIGIVENKTIWQKQKTKTTTKNSDSLYISYYQTYTNEEEGKNFSKQNLICKLSSHFKNYAYITMHVYNCIYIYIYYIYTHTHI